MGRTKRQHYVPRFYLERFTDGDGSVWNYEKGTGESLALSPEDTAVETNFYSPRTEQGYFDGIEKWLSDVESEACSLFSDVISGKPLAAEARAKFATYLAAQYARSPTFFRAHAEMKAKLLQGTTLFICSDWDRFNSIMDRVDAEQGKSRSEAERKEAFSMMRDTEKYEVHVSRELSFRAIEAADKLAPIFYKMSWLTVVSQEAHIITSDNPVVRVVDPTSVSPAYGDGGFSNRTAWVTFPLSPRACLEMTWAKHADGIVMQADRERIKLYNRQRAMFAEKKLYSSVRDAGIANLARKYPGCAFGLEVSGEENMAPVVVRRRFAD